MGYRSLKVTQTGIKNVEDMYNHLDRIPACDRRTDGRTNRQTDILPRHRPRYAHTSRGINRTPYAYDILTKTSVI